MNRLFDLHKNLDRPERCIKRTFCRGASDINLSGTRTVVGSGKTNTQQIIVPVLNRRGDDGAALRCTTLNINGYTDWFLPSQDELNMMYNNLLKRGLGNLYGGMYWSSSHSTNLWRGEHCSIAQNFSDGKQDWYWRKDT